ncbi:MAG: hypothetical protein RBU37_27060 [Myxococcota bacterium]|jgi:hypothetical protein|nr:hypothetical protein [Myxococcota bacterium]
MFELMVMPLRALWEEDDENKVIEEVRQLQALLSEAFDKEVTWNEEMPDGEELEIYGLDPHCVYSLRAAAAWLEFTDKLEGFDPGEEPWNHEVFERLEEAGEAKRFPQLLHSENADAVAFVPVELDNVIGVDDEEPPSFAVGSLPALRRELDELRIALGLESGLEDKLEDLVFDDDVDPIASARYGWVVLSRRCNDALAKDLPLVMVVEDEEDEEHEHDESCDHEDRD